MKKKYYLLLGCLIIVANGLAYAKTTDSILDFLPAILSAVQSTDGTPTVKPPPPPKPPIKPNGPPYVYTSTLSSNTGVPGAAISVRGIRLANQYNEPIVKIGAYGIILRASIAAEKIIFYLPTVAEMEAAGVRAFNGSLPVVVTIDYGIDSSGENRWFSLDTIIITNIPKPIPRFITAIASAVATGKVVRIDVYDLNAADASNLQDIRISIGSNPRSPVAKVAPIAQGQYNRMYYDPDTGKQFGYYGYIEFIVPDSATGVHQLWIGRVSHGNTGWNSVTPDATRNSFIDVYTLTKPVFRGLWPSGETFGRIVPDGYGKYEIIVQFKIDLPDLSRIYGHVEVNGTQAGKTFWQWTRVLNSKTMSFRTVGSETKLPKKIEFTLSYTDYYQDKHTSSLISVDLQVLDRQRISEVTVTKDPEKYYALTGFDITFDTGLPYSGSDTHRTNAFFMWIDGVISQENALKIYEAKTVFLKLPSGKYNMHILPIAGAPDVQSDFSEILSELIVSPILSGTVVREYVNAAQGGEFSLGGLKIIIPAGALSGDSEIVLRQFTPSILDTDDPIADDQHGFKISFSDQSVVSSLPIEVHIPYEDKQGGDTSDIFAAFYDETVEAYGMLETVIENGLAKVTIPAIPLPAPSPWLTHPPTYEDAVSAVQNQFPAINTILKSLAVIRTASTASSSIDTTRKIKVISPTDPTASGYVSPAVAGQILSAAREAYKLYIDDLSFPKPTGWIYIYTKDLGTVNSLSGIAGSTTAGIFGQPYILINSQLRGDFLKTTVAHEFGHAMQRQINTNLRALWLDEGVANWGAWKIFGGTPDLLKTAEIGASFPQKTFPTSWWIRWNGLDQEESYATMSFFVWLEKKYGKTVIKTLYDKMVASPLNWNSPERTIEQATGSSMVTIANNFAKDYWMQTYPPLDEIGLPIQTRSFSTGNLNLQLNEARPASSSTSYEVSVDPKSLTELTGRDVVLRVTAAGSYTVYVWAYGQKNGTVPLAPLLLKTVGATASNKSAYLGRYGENSRLFYRIVVNNYSGSSINTKIVMAMPAIDVNNTGQRSGPRTGGYSVSYSASGLGDTPGTVLVGNMSVTPTGWNDNGVIFNMPSVPDSWGQATIKVLTAEGARSNSVDFMFTD